MAQDIGSATASNLENVQTDFSVAPETTDAQGVQKLTPWMNRYYAQWLAYYKSDEVLGAVVDTKAMYAVGKGFTGSEEILNKITGIGKGESFNSIIENAIRVSEYGGDFYAEIITADDKPIKDDGSNLLNLKPLDPDVMRHMITGKGIIKYFDQMTKNYPRTKVHRFKPHEIFYLPRNRTADEVHGTPITKRLVSILLMKQEAMSDMKTLMHRNIKPYFIFELNTDDPTKIAAFKAQKDAATKGAENIYVAMGSVKATPVVMAPGAIGEALKWIEQLNSYIYQAGGVPKSIIGDAAGSTEAGSKVVSVGFQQTIVEIQLFLKENIKNQLHLEVNYKAPASLLDSMEEDEKKDTPINSERRSEFKP